jgi:hypothetical protein
MSCCSDNWVVPGANPSNTPGGVESVGAGTPNVTITGTAINPLVNVTNLGGVTQVEGQTGNINLNGVGMTIVGGTPVAGDVTFTAAVQSIASANGSITVTQPTAGNFNLAVASTIAPVQIYLKNLSINPAVQAPGNNGIVPIIAGTGVTFASCGINPALYNYVEVSMGFSAAADINTNFWTFYAVANDGQMTTLGDSIYQGAAGTYNPIYCRFIMSKALGNFRNTSTSFNMVKDDSFSPFPNGFIIYNVPYLFMAVRAFN